MSEWVNGWIDKWMNGWMKGCINGWRDGWINEESMDESMDGWMKMQSCGQKLPFETRKWRKMAYRRPPHTSTSGNLHFPQWFIAKSWVGGAYWQSMSSGLGGHFEHFWGSRCIIWDDFDVIWGIFDVSIWMTLARVQKDMFCPNRFQWCHATLRSN